MKEKPRRPLWRTPGPSIRANVAAWWRKSPAWSAISVPQPGGQSHRAVSSGAGRLRGRAEWGTITLIVHSHPDATTQPSELDKAQCDAMELPWAIASWPEGDLRTSSPRGELPLVGRQFVLGHTDCWGLVMSYYRQEHGLALPDYRADYPWWERGENRYLDNWHACGFASLAACRSQEIWRSRRFRRRWPTTPAFCWQMACCCTICTACSAARCLTAVTGRSER